MAETDVATMLEFMPVSPMKPKPLVHRSRPLFAEQLERRMVLSACGVECEVSGGQLNILGTTADDSIAIQYEPLSNLIRVFGGESEFLGTFPVGSVRQIYVDGLAEDDRLEIDPGLPVALRVNGGEGEDTLAGKVPASHAGHEHEAAVIFNVERFGPTVRSPAAPASPAPERLLPADVGASLVAADAHATHGSQALSFTPHHDEAQLVSIAAGDHQHTTVGSHHYDASLRSHADAHWLARNNPLSPSGAEMDADSLSSASHGRHTTTNVSAEVSSKVAPKRCTTTYVGRDLNRSIFGERQCDCEAKAAAKQAAKRAAESDGAQTPSPGRCLPCQNSWLAAPADVGYCMMGLEVSLQDVLDAHEDPLMAESKQRESAQALAEEGSVVASSLRIAGYAMLATGASLIPFLLKRKKRRPREIDDVMALDLDWVAGCRTCFSYA